MTKAAITKPTSSSCRSLRTAQAGEWRDVVCRLDSVVDLHEGSGKGSECRAGGCEPHHGHGRQQRQQPARDRGDDEEAKPEDAAAHGTQPVQADAGGVRDVAQQRLARSGTRHVEHRAQQTKHNEPAKTKPEEGVHDGQRRNRGSGTEVGEDHHPAAPNPVYEVAAEESGRDAGDSRNRGDQTGRRRFAGAFEHQPGKDDSESGVAQQRGGAAHQVCGKSNS
ncbi:MAG: hypothetical protein Q4D79_02250 [Propionibacteriaceae bacterium]|nr:hypothetical protein [Propionibacteriaceae bacterium]